MFDLFHLYIEQFDNIIEKFYEIEKASSENFGEESDDAQKLKSQSNLEITHVYYNIFTL